MSTAERNYGIDALRILAILFVVTLHTLGHGGILDAVDSISGVHYASAWLLEILALVAVDCFVLITGFVMCGTQFRVRRILALWLEAFFYSVAIALTVNLFAPEYVSHDDAILAFFPVLGDRWWFFTSYFGLFLLMPFLNKLVKSLDSNQVNLLFKVCLALSVMPLLASDNIFKLQSGYSLFWFVVLYLMGSCLKLRQQRESATPKKNSCLPWLGGYLLFVLATWVLHLVGHLELIQSPWFTLRVPMLIDYTSPFVVGGALCLFCFFSKLPVTNKRVGSAISWVSSHVFAVYLISDNRILRQIFTSDAYGWMASLSIPDMVLHVGEVVLVTFVACLIIDAVRTKLFKLARIDKAVDRLGSFVDSKIRFGC